MFKKLKRKFILTNLLTSTIVLAAAFVAIYFVAAGSASRRVNPPFERPLQSQDPGQQTDAPQQEFQPQESLISDFNQEMAARIEEERQASLQSLLISLIVTGVAVEIFIAIISFYLAEQSIKPVREAYNAQKDFIANASHEIKTPLAVIQANLEAADIKGNKWLDNVAKKTEDLTNLNNQLLALARSEAKTDDIKLSETDLKKLIDNTISAFEPKAAEKGITLSKTDKNPNANHRKINRQALEQILNIYIDNGIKYGKKHVEIILKRNSIAVSSDGKLMNREKIPQLFDRFYQTDKSSEGVGLGLSIAKSIAEKNGWELNAYVDEKNKLNIFEIELK